jgi:CheY-like chemotaxis protein
MIDIDNMSILVVDDMKSMRLTVRKMLQNLHIGKKLKFAGNGKEGLEVLGSMKFDLAIIDWNMPVMTGVEMLEQVRADKTIRDLPVIMVTAEAERDIVSTVAETEVDGYLLKPLTLSSLDKKIKAVIEKVNNPSPVTIHRLKARELEEMGDYESAIEQTRMALNYNPSASKLLRQLGLLHFRIKKNNIGEKCLLKAASVNHQDTITRVDLADYYLKRELLEKAAQYCSEILILSSKYNDKAYDLAETLLKKGIRKQAIDLFSKVIARSQKQSVVREQVIDFCLENNEIEYPKQLLEFGIKESPSNYELIYKLGVIRQDAGDWEKALKNFIEVDRHVRGHIDSKLQIAKIYFMNRKVLQADDYLNQILRLDPRNEAAIALRREF